jgi:YidC/Oxa1 family membrane protein insertase
MDQQRRLLTFTVLSFLILFGWMSVGPKLFPAMFPPPAKPIKNPEAKPDDPVADDKGADDNKLDKADKPEAVVAVADAKLPEHDTKTVVIGSDDPKSGYGLKVTLSSVGAGIVSAELNDPRYKALKPRKAGADVPQLSLLGNDLEGELKPLTAAPPVTGQLAVSDIDKKLKKLDADANLARLNWDVINEEAEANGGIKKSVTFGIKTPDGVWELRKKYEIRRWQDANAKRDEDPAGYQLAVQLSFKNLSSKEQTVVYDLQGPAGLPLENADNASKFRDVKVGFREQDGGLTPVAVASTQVVKEFDNGKIEELKVNNRTFQYAGLDTQYFTALVLPQDAAQKQTSYLDFAKPQVVQKNPAKPGWSEVSVQLHSAEHTVPAEDEITHDYNLYLGPKRGALLSPLGADKVIEFSGFLFIPASLVAGIASLLLVVLNFFHRTGLPYGICIMLLTVLVRSCMFPISRKQAINAKRMKEIQPRLTELKTKYADDKQKFAEEQMKLFAETGFNPLSGCLPVLMQLPIFIGLYQALSSSVDLRRAAFLWFDNLAAPDALFLLPMKLPFLGNEFNLLPILTTALFLFQQKMFMPPPTDEQTRMQAKVFFWMTLMMGFMFYHVPAGLCVYFIASSLWSMGERKLLDRVVPNPPPSTELKKGGDSKGGPAKPANNFWSRMRDKLEEMGEMQDVNGIPVSGQRKQRDKDKRKSRP